jgi:hypothetical protein
MEDYLEVVERIALLTSFDDRKPVLSDDVAASLLAALEKGDRPERIRAALVCMNLAFSFGIEEADAEKEALRLRFQSLSAGLGRMLASCDVPSVIAASWAYAWIGEHRMLARAPKPEILLSLYKLWRQIEPKRQARYPGWALSSQQLLPRNAFDSGIFGDCDVFLQQAVADGGHWRLGESRRAALVVGWYRCAPWTDPELAEQLGKIIEGRPLSVQPPTIRELLENLGDAGRRVLAEHGRRVPEREVRQKETKPDKVPRRAARRARMPRR